MITIFDLETTGLRLAEGNDLSVQPYMVEIYAIQVDDNDNIIKEMHQLIKPPIPIPYVTTKIHGISDYDVRNSPTFVEIYKDLCEVFFESHTMVAHNLSYDKGVTIDELKRIGKEYSFPYPPINFCTVEQSMHIRGYRLKNGELYKIATGLEIIDAHQAKNDVLATFESYKWLKSQRKK